MKMDLPGGQPDDHEADQAFDGRELEAADVVGSIGCGSGVVRRTPRVLIIAQGPDRRASLSRAIRTEDVVCRLADTQRDALELLGRERDIETIPFEAVVLDIDRCSVDSLRFVRAMGDRKIATVIVCPNVSFDEAVEAMRAGACDIVSSTVKPVELQRRIRSAIAQSRSLRTAVVTPAPRPVSDGTRPRATRLADKNPISPRAIDGITEDFELMIRNQLDIETLLRQSLEFILQQGGPTNAAVFLPGTTGDYALGAYVNFSCPKDTAEMLLDHLANVAAPRLEDIDSLIHCRTPRAIREAIGEGAEWLEDGEMVAFACRAKGEALAIFVLFRDRSTPFSDHLRAVLSRLAPVFGQQLARVVRIHHRHLPKDKWGALGDGPISDDDSGGMAA
jgi:DNA-binding response OmpR family regulator